MGCSIVEPALGHWNNSWNMEYDLKAGDRFRFNDLHDLGYTLTIQCLDPFSYKWSDNVIGTWDLDEFIHRIESGALIKEKASNFTNLYDKLL